MKALQQHAPCRARRAAPGAGRRALSVRAAAAAPAAAPAKAGPGAETCRVAVLGASGYTGAEVVRLSALHPHLTITALTGDRQAGKAFSEVFPHLVAAADVPRLAKIDDVDFSAVDAVFCCLPHATTQKIISALPEHLKIVDLSADFRLANVDTYAEWYGGEHSAPELQKTAVYGLTEVYRDAIAPARLVANPGCYPTTVQLPLHPLLRAGLISPDDIIIDAKSGVSGAGRSAKESNLYAEIAEGINAYGVTKHRHMPEIEQGLSDAAGKPVTVSFTPHLMPMSRGMQSTMYVKLAGGASVEDLRAKLAETYAGEPFVRVLEPGVVPHTRHVRGTNFCLVNVFPDRLPGRAIVISVIDNLVKGASGQAMQNLNLICGFPETTALMQLALFP
ncbi:N-acetyl-gamma-glutamyl-phosphate reductase [Scenedesmus sp. PABB004]|nr:N-acetyl-gamma-glutamyl-phosphate reductase [Scenedesmus sp. PABB004]